MAPPTDGVPAIGGPSEPDVLALLLGWLPGRRWYPAKGTQSAPEPVGVIELVDPLGAGQVGLHLFRLGSGAVLQVPVVLRAAAGRPEALGTVRREGVDLEVLDGCADPAFLRAWLGLARREGGLPPDLVAGDLDAPGAARVLSGEQSNTSVLLPRAEPPAILKVFRVVTPGHNPDVAVPSALHGAGWTGVPRPLGWLSGSWSAEGATEGTTGDLGVVSELVLGARDGFELACARAGAGEDVSGLTHELGRTTAQLHSALRRALPTEQGPADVAAVVGTLRARAAAAIDAVPTLADRAERVLGVLDLVGTVGTLPALQRVHGDYHLGQVLHSPDRGWFVLDFEGEPSASAAERERPDLALRDLAGMLRSLDYAAAVGGAGDPGWLEAARSALTEGYRSESAALGSSTDIPAQTTLLRALELDKALYEVVYETRNRPSWTAIPLAGVDRLLASDES
ncbi:aminoglycoside phosphotransferase [Actinotalea sp.]|uniref:maltokinase N-terminal cap-like domain-containing protein n=1 Tax=Actinotalea sp. TaxID=1872145 RepID=UPI0035632CF0